MTVQICRAATGPTACYAERELKRYLRKYSGAAFGEGAELTFRLEVDEDVYKRQTVPHSMTLECCRVFEQVLGA